MVDLQKVFADDGKGHIIVNIPYLEVYIPMSRFDKSGKYAEDNGDTIRAVACLPIGIFENDKFVEYRTIKLGEIMDFYVGDSETETKQLPGMEKPEPVRTLRYRKGDIVFDNYIIQNSLNVQKFIEMVLGGKLPSTLAYDQAMGIWTKNLSMNKVNLAVPFANLELILSVTCRDKTDPTKTFAQKIAENPNVSMYDYVGVNMRQICQYSSTFSALTFEDFDAMATSSVRRTKMKMEEPVSPLEQIIKM